MKKTNRLLERLVGFWSGEGKDKGGSIRDELEWQWTIDNKFLRMNTSSPKGDSFKAEGYIWHNEAQSRIEFFEFSNGPWPVRILMGDVTGDKMVLEEKTEDRHIRLTLEVENDNTLRLTEAYVKGDKLEPFVEETFRRRTRK